MGFPFHVAPSDMSLAKDGHEQEGTACELAGYTEFPEVAVLGRSLISGAVRMLCLESDMTTKHRNLGHLASNKGAEVSNEGEEIKNGNPKPLTLPSKCFTLKQAHAYFSIPCETPLDPTAHVCQSSQSWSRKTGYS